MTSALYSHPACLGHTVPEGHPECPERLKAVLAAFEREDFHYLHRVEAPRADLETIALVHPQAHIEAIFAREAECAKDPHGYVQIDPDTVMMPGSGEAILRAAGAVVAAIDEVMMGHLKTAFCAVRPPGHHAEPGRAMGFCFVNNVAVGAAHLRRDHGLERVAVVDFDVHHGNGTQAAFEGDPGFFYVSTHQSPLYPGTGAREERGTANNILNATLPPGAGSDEFRMVMSEEVLPALETFKPQFILISAGFDAHVRDPLANLRLVESDYYWATRALMELARTHGEGRVVSTLEGGYDLRALALSAAEHMRALMGA